jgi:hypothetical protein
MKETSATELKMKKYRKKKPTWRRRYNPLHERPGDMKRLMKAAKTTIHHSVRLSFLGLMMALLTQICPKNQPNFVSDMR